MEFINVLFLSMFFYFTTQASSCPFNNQRPKIIAIGRPFGSIKTTWCSVNSTSLPVTYQVHFNKTSPYTHCENAMADALYTANQCTQNSSKGGILHECDLTENVKRINMDFQDSLCVVISMFIPSTNQTCYSLYKEYNTYLEPVAICPAPDIQAFSPDPGKLTVNWNVSHKFVGVEALKDISFIINYEPARPSSTCTIRETKTLSALNYDFVYEHNTHSIDNLESCCLYRVTMCCTFSTGIPECNAKYISGPSYAITAEHVPLSAPQIENYAIQNKNLFMKWKIPSNVSCKDNVTEYEINYWEDFHDNCSSSSNSSSVLKYVTNKTYDREAMIPGVLPSIVYCFCIRMCRRPGCSPWSMTYSVKDTTQTTIKNTPSGDKFTNTEMAAMLSVLGTLVLVLTILFICQLIKGRNEPPRRRRLEDTVGELEGATDLLESSQSTADMDSDYATA